MIMQIVRCESAVTQGLRSDIFQATKKAESASVRLPHTLHSLWPVSCGPPPSCNQPGCQVPLNFKCNWLMTKPKTTFCDKWQCNCLSI